MLQIVFIAIVGTWFYNLFEVPMAKKIGYCLLSILAYLILFFVLSTIIGIVLISLGFDDAFKDFNFVITIGVSIISFGALYAAREYILKKRATGVKATHISN